MLIKLFALSVIRARWKLFLAVFAASGLASPDFRLIILVFMFCFLPIIVAVMYEVKGLNLLNAKSRKLYSSLEILLRKSSDGN